MLGENPFTLVQTDVTLLTDPDTCEGPTGILVRLTGKEGGGRRNVPLRRPWKCYFSNFYTTLHTRMTHHIQGTNVYTFTAPSTGCFSSHMRTDLYVM